ncbi:hypothetical protein KFL_000320210 [Klebsormidium nitens]|uniref:N-acetyltransferase domain-containing protein n=1 Tax=Klebsormidium nitens TaxID=105231 RepID=A0A1Y1HP14_KLENI|nr:hypothetical protein KFL_000320210 [Klebsormidium nitens]|eukprot:GAQ79522.1 hypothetical protein KFL_000320210 [Klebsormidium nitens]
MLKAEILDTLLRMRNNSKPGKYFSLVAVPQDDSKPGGRQLENLPSIVGSVDLILLQKEDVLRFIEGASEYMYVSGMAVHNEYKRQGIGTLLLKGVESKVKALGIQYIALQVYAENHVAQTLYEKAGYQAVHTSSAWALETMLPGTQGKRRVLMIKRMTS